MENFVAIRLKIYAMECIKSTFGCTTVIIWWKKIKIKALLLSWTRMRTLTVRRTRRFLDPNIWPAPTILHLAQSLGEDVVIGFVVFINGHLWHPPATTILFALWHRLDVNGNRLPFEKWRKIFVIIVIVVFAFFGAFGIWFVNAFLFCLFFFLWNRYYLIMMVF